MATTKLYFNAFVPAFSNLGVALGNSQLLFYYTKTTTKAPVYADAGATIPLPNPVQADMAGKYPNIYLDASISYRVQQTDKNGANIGDAVDPYTPGQAIAGPIGPTGSITLNGVTFTTPQQWGAVADDTTDCWGAFNTALVYLKTKSTSGYYNRGAPRLYIPTGNYYLSQPLDIDLITLIVEGDGTGQAGGNATVLRFPANCAGIRIQRYDTQGAALKATASQGADGTIIRNLALQGGGGTANILNSGLWMRSRATFRDVTSMGFAGAGILIRATSGSSDPTFEGNANNWRVDTARLTGNGCGGLVIQGADANAGISHGVDASNNTGYGIDDSAFLGNKHSGFQMEANSLGPWRTSGANGFFWMDGYTEPGQPNSIASPNTIATGPQFVGVTGGTVLRASGLDGGGLGSSNGFYAKRYKTDGTTALKSIHGADPANSEWDQFFTPGGVQYGLAHLGNDDFGVLVGTVFEGLRVKSSVSAEKFGRPSNATTRGVPQMQNGVWLGLGTNARSLNYVTASTLATAMTALNGQEVAVGDKYFFSQPQPGGTEGVVVTTAGVVGGAAVLKTFGSISA